MSGEGSSVVCFGNGYYNFNLKDAAHTTGLGKSSIRAEYCPSQTGRH